MGLLLLYLNKQFLNDLVLISNTVNSDQHVI